MSLSKIVRFSGSYRLTAVEPAWPAAAGPTNLGARAI
jgi:hypothetical protein